MNMRVSEKLSAAVLLLVMWLAWAGCRPERDYIYEVNQVRTETQLTDKKNRKTDEQYISILYANLFQKALSANELNDILDVVESVGDKQSVYEVIISNFMNRSDKIIPTDSVMRNDIPLFVEETYKRFLVRSPSEAERSWFVNFISSHDKVTAELVYVSFALCNEYLYY